MTNRNIKNLEQELTEMYGGVIGNADLRQVLGYKSFSSFNRAVRMGLLGVKVFEIESRRGKFALTSDIANWLCELKNQNQTIKGGAE